MENAEGPLDSWIRLSDGLIAGVHHTLNNRLGALSAVSQIIESDLPANHPLAGALNAEIHRLEISVGVLRLLSGGAGDPQPLQVGSTIEDASRLLSLHHGLRDVRLDVSVDDTLLPLWTDPSHLLRALLLMMAVAGRRANGGDGTVRVAATGDAKTVRIEVEASGGDETAGSYGLVGVEVDGAEVLLKAAGGELETKVGAEGITMSAILPTLPEVRRREAAGGS
jgi:hypothetical protein